MSAGSGLFLERHLRRAATSLTAMAVLSGGLACSGVFVVPDDELAPPDSPEACSPCTSCGIGCAERCPSQCGSNDGRSSGDGDQIDGGGHGQGDSIGGGDTLPNGDLDP